jgi:hypothetical protein
MLVDCIDYLCKYMRTCETIVLYIQIIFRLDFVIDLFEYTKCIFKIKLI